MSKGVLSSDKTPLLSKAAQPQQHKRLDQTTQVDSISLWRDTSVRQKFLLFYIFWSQFSVFLCVTVPNPFMTKAILGKGGTAIESAIILQITLLTMALSSVVFGKCQIYVDSKMMLLIGLIVFAACQVCFGLLSIVEDMKVFLAGGIAIKILQGIGQGAFAVSALTIVCQEFTDHASKVFGMSESLTAVGFISGPMLGSALYSISESILLPFVISGGMLLPLIPVGYCLLRKYRKEDNDNTFSVTELIFRPPSVFILGMTAITSGGFGLINVLGGAYMESRGFTIIQVGSALLVAAASYSLTAAIAGFIVGSSYKVRRTLYSIGSLGVIFYQFIFTPVQSFTGIFIGMIIEGAISALIFVCGFTELLYLTGEGKIEATSDFAMHSALSGVWNLTFGIGAFLIPLVGSQLSSVLRYQLVAVSCTTGGAVIAALFALVVAILQSVKRNCCEKIFH